VKNSKLGNDVFHARFYHPASGIFRKEEKILRLNKLKFDLFVSRSKQSHFMILYRQILIL